jgi:hypothetical protein
MASSAAGRQHASLLGEQPEILPKEISRMEHKAFKFQAKRKALAHLEARSL